MGHHAGKVLVALRKSRGFTREELAAKADLSVSAVGTVERDPNFTERSSSTLRKIADAMEIPLPELVAQMKGNPLILHHGAATRQVDNHVVELMQGAAERAGQSLLDWAMEILTRQVAGRRVGPDELIVTEEEEPPKGESSKPNPGQTWKTAGLAW